MEEFQNKSGIYRCLCTANNKSYIGQSVNVRIRKRTHERLLENNKHKNIHLQNAYNKYGKECFKWSVLEYCDKEKMDEREMYWIKYYDSYSNGFNRNKGGQYACDYEKAIKHKETVSACMFQYWQNADDKRKEFSERMKGRNNPMYGKRGKLSPSYGRHGNNNSMLGKHQTEQAKELNREKHLGLKNKNAKPIICIETQTFYESQGDAKRKTGIDDTSINKVLRQVKKTAGGYHWRYATQEEINNYKELQININT